MTQDRIYMDNSATSQTDPQVVEAMLPFFTEVYAVASSQFSHTPGTQAREGLNIVTVLFNNRAYRILQGELKRVGAKRIGHTADSLLNLDNPQLNFVQIAQGMGVEASRADSAESFNNQFATALNKSGPHLIEALV